MFSGSGFYGIGIDVDVPFGKCGSGICKVFAFKKKIHLDCPLNIYLQEYVPYKINWEPGRLFQEVFVVSEDI